MRLKYLLPNRYKRIGWVVLVPSAILGLVSLVNDWNPEIFQVKMPAIFVDDFGTSPFRLVGFVQDNFLNELLGILVIISSLVVAFSKEKDEDELISNIRLESLVWATYFNYAVLLLAILFVYGMSFFWVMIFNMFTILWFFIIRFNLRIRKLRKSVGNEE